MIPDFKTYLRESSAWSGILDRGRGDAEKKEDNIDHLNFDEFYEYLQKSYESVDGNKYYIVFYPYNSQLGIDRIQIPIEIIPIDGHTTTLITNTPPVSIDYSRNNKKITDVIIGSKLFKKYPNLENKLTDKYTIDKSLVSPHISPKNGELTNTVCVDIIDTILGIVDNPLLKKIS